MIHQERKRSGRGVGQVRPHMPTPARERGRIAPVRLSHVVRRTSRLDEMAEWYLTVLEAEVVFANEMLAFLTYDDEHHRIAIAAVPGLPDRAEMAAGTDHVAFTYDDLDALIQTYRRLKAIAITPFWAIHHGPTISMYFKDPDGNSVELLVDCFDTPEATNDWLTSGSFERNPIGVNFDPEDLSKRHEAGEPLAELMKQPPLPEGKDPFDMLRF